MDYAIYFFLDCLDTLAVTFIMLAIFQYPIREYLREIALLCGILGLSSLIAREVFGVAPVFDLLIHIVLLIVGLRIFVRSRLYRAIFIVTVGAVVFVAVQSITAAVYQSTGLLGDSLTGMDNSFSVRVAQLTTQAICYIAAYVVVALDLGKTKWVRPPHDFYIGASASKDRKPILIVSLASITALTLGAYIFIHNDVLAAAALVSALVIAVIMYTYRREEKNERRDHGNLKSYRNSDS